MKNSRRGMNTLAVHARSCIIVTSCNHIQPSSHQRTTDFLRKRRSDRAFTLIELSVVLVIIGLIAGGILVGRDLVNAGYVRAQLSQIEQFTTATNTFYGKYGYLPGDIPNPYANQYSFAAPGPSPGQGDGNGLIEGRDTVPALNGLAGGIGETVTFWNDLGRTKLIPGTYIGQNTYFTFDNTSVTPSTTPALKDIFPEAKIGQGNYIYVYSYNSVNFFGLSGVTQLANTWQIISNPQITVSQAYAIDSKIDDGLPAKGRVVASRYLSYGSLTGSPNASSDSSITCYNNSTGKDSLSQDNGNDMNCALSFNFK